MSMNNSDQPLSSFEEKLTAYIDGRLPEAEAAAFEREHPEVVQERISVRRLGTVLQRGTAAPILRNPEFLNRQILREIVSDAPAEALSEERKPSFFNLWRLVFAGAFCLLAGLGIYQAFVAPA